MVVKKIRKWYKQIVSYKTRKEAQRYAAECRKEGYPAKVEKSNDPYDQYPYHIYTGDK